MTFGHIKFRRSHSAHIIVRLARLNH